MSINPVRRITNRPVAKCQVLTQVILTYLGAGTIFTAIFQMENKCRKIKLSKVIHQVSEEQGLEAQPCGKEAMLSGAVLSGVKSLFPEFPGLICYPYGISGSSVSPAGKSA
jgi:hypothetical protein